jgi:hypothetical protein
MLRRLGDIALFIAGMFSPSLKRKVVGVDYYINMGGGAYDWLSDSLASTGDRSLDWKTFRELAENFQDMVFVLDDFAGNSGMRDAAENDTSLGKPSGCEETGDNRASSLLESPTLDFRTCH